MWNLLKKRPDECGRSRDLLEESTAAAGHAASVEELLTALPAGLRAHIAACANCREAAQELVESREIFKDYGFRGEQAGTWFVTRVMATIEAREHALALSMSPWSAVPRLASRLVWVSALLFLAAGTWLYEKPVSAPATQPTLQAAPELLFEAPQPPSTHDEVLISLAERDQ